MTVEDKPRKDYQNMRTLQGRNKALTKDPKFQSAAGPHPSGEKKLISKHEQNINLLLIPLSKPTHRLFSIELEYLLPEHENSPFACVLESP